MRTWVLLKELGNDTFVKLAIRCIEHCYELDSSYFGESSKKIFDKLREDAFADLSIGKNDLKTIDALYNTQSLKEFRIVNSIADLNEIIKKLVQNQWRCHLWRV